MMPWEHAIVSYIGYSLFLRAVYREAPTANETAIVVFASLLPDLIDKPLAWQFDLFATGHALGHSVFVAVPLSVAVLALAWHRDQLRAGFAFAIGYLLHLPADVVPPRLRGDSFAFERVLWPVRGSGSGYGTGFHAEALDNLTGYFGWMLTELSSGSPDPYLFVLLGVGVFGLALWIADGMPIGREFYAVCRRVVREDPGV